MALAAAPVDHEQRPAVAHVEPAATPSQTTARQRELDREKAAQDDRSRYAAKEARSGDAEDYRGGDTVVIGASAATAILAVILLLVLI